MSRSTEKVMRQEREVEEGIKAGVESRDSAMMLRVVWGERDQRLDMASDYIFSPALPTALVRRSPLIGL